MSIANELKPYEKAFIWKRISAFLTTSMALFCLMSLLTSTSIKEFTTTTKLQIHSDMANTHSHVKTIIEEQTSDQQLSNFVAAAASNADLIANADIATHNLAVIRDSLGIQLSGEQDQRRFILSIQYRGKGTDCEKYLTRNFAQALARRLDSRLIDVQQQTQLSDLIAKVEDRIRISSDIHYSDLESASANVARINDDLSNLHHAVQNLKSESGNQYNGHPDIDPERIIASVRTLDQIKTAINQLGSPGIQINMESIEVAFDDMRDHLVGLQNTLAEKQIEGHGPIRVVNTSIPSRSSAAGPILGALEAIDTDSLDLELKNLRESVRGNAIKLREGLANVQMASNSLPRGNLIVDSIAKLKTAPIQSGPGLPHLILFSLISCFIGSCIAMSYKPALDSVGFASLDDTTQSLGLPVVATLNQQVDPADQNTKTKRVGFANTIVRFSEIALFAFLLLIILLCIVQSDVREAMFANPFYGLSKISSFFFG